MMRFEKSFTTALFAFSVLVGTAAMIAKSNYDATQGTGTTFGSATVGGVHFPKFFICDPTTVTQCTVVSAGGALRVGTQPVTTIDGGNVAIGTTTDSACAGDATSGCTELSRLSRIAARLSTLITNLGSANANGQAVMASSSPVVLASNQTVADPCMFQNKTNLAINQNGTSSVQLIALSGSTVIYVCSLSLIAAGATTMAITTGTGSACVTNNAAVIGTTTSNIANSVSFAANGGMTLGNGQGTVAKGAASSELCMILGTSVYVSGNLTYVQQ